MPGGVALVCPDKFRGTLTAPAAAAAMAAGCRTAGYGEVRAQPLADGGDGMLDVIHATVGGSWRDETVTGPDGEPVAARWLLLSGGTAVVEMARASGQALMGGRHRPAGRHHPGDGGADRVGVAGRSALGGGRHGRKRHHRRWLGGGRGPERRVPGGAGDHGLLRRADALRRRRLRLRATEGRLIGPGPPADPAPGGSRGGVPAPFRRRRLGAAGRRRRRGLAGGLAALGAELGSGFDVVAGLTPLRRRDRRRRPRGHGEGASTPRASTARWWARSWPGPSWRGYRTGRSWREPRPTTGSRRRAAAGDVAVLTLVDRAWDDDDAFRRAGVLVEEATVEAPRGALGATGAR